MGDGWETRRSRDPANTDWVIIKLGAVCKKIRAIEMETTHFKGNFPHRFRIEALTKASPVEGKEEVSKFEAGAEWTTLVTEREGKAHARFVFKDDLNETPSQGIQYIKITVIPDGGVSRLRVYCLKQDLAL
jgi:allantoicase